LWEVLHSCLPCDRRYLEAISKKRFWFKIAAGPRFPRWAGFPSGFIPLRVKTGGILEYFEDLKRGTNKMSLGTNKMSLIRLWRVGPKDFFEIASIFL
jgi:hypothetical protein